jgi:hypothetical protein
MSRRLLFLAAAVLLAGTRMAHALEEKTLLAPDGTLYVVRAGTGADLGIAAAYVAPNDNVLQWSSLHQDGTRDLGLITGTAGASFKHNVDLAFDEPTSSLIVLWTEEVPLVNLLRLGILRANQWTVSDLLPTNGFPHARNPQMLLSHPVVHTQDADGNDVATTRSLLSVIWWEESNISQARYAPIFFDEDSTASRVQVYDLPATIGGGGPASGAKHPATAYEFPSLQLEGIGGAILASFADLSSDKQYVVRISFPDNLGKPGPNNVTWQRRRIPVVGIASDEPIAPDVPVVIESVKTVIGSSYRPTLIWSTGDAVGYTRFDGQKWSPALTIPLTESMTYDRALRLVQEMATRN